MCDNVVCDKVVRDKAAAEEEEEAKEAEEAEERDTESKTRIPHKDVGKNKILRRTYRYYDNTNIHI